MGFSWSMLIPARHVEHYLAYNKASIPVCHLSFVLSSPALGGGTFFPCWPHLSLLSLLREAFPDHPTSAPAGPRSLQYSVACPIALRFNLFTYLHCILKVSICLPFYRWHLFLTVIEIHENKEFVLFTAVFQGSSASREETLHDYPLCEGIVGKSSALSSVSLSESRQGVCLPCVCVSTWDES